MTACAPSLLCRLICRRASWRAARGEIAESWRCNTMCRVARHKVERLPQIALTCRAGSIFAACRLGSLPRIGLRAAVSQLASSFDTATSLQQGVSSLGQCTLGWVTRRLVKRQAGRRDDLGI